MFKPLATLALASVFSLTACGGGSTPAPERGPQPLNASTSIGKVNITVRPNEVDVGSVTLQTPSAGKVEVTFAGDGVVSAGDRLVLAASDKSKTWGVNEGNVSLKTSGPFTHKRVYTVGAGSSTFYAVAHNYVDTAGTGVVSIYATLTAIFYPN